MTFEKLIYKRMLITADIKNALDYLNKTNQNEEHDRLSHLLTHKKTLTSDNFTHNVINAYQNYWQVIFKKLAYENNPNIPLIEENARKDLLSHLSTLINVNSTEIEDIEILLEENFTKRNSHFLGGRTGLFYGPYIWADEEIKHLNVTIFDQQNEIKVHLLKDIQSISWLNWLSNGEFSTAGWALGNSIYCIPDAYDNDLTSDKFLISFLKHETQHILDYKYPTISNYQLEYRAKLVELYYYSSSDFLYNLIHSSDKSNQENGHPYASYLIVRHLSEKMNLDSSELQAICLNSGLWEENKSKIKRFTRHLFDQSTVFLEEKLERKS